MVERGLSWCGSRSCCTETERYNGVLVACESRKKKRDTKKCGTGSCPLAGEERAWRQCGTVV